MYSVWGLRSWHSPLMRSVILSLRVLEEDLALAHTISAAVFPVSEGGVGLRNRERERERARERASERA